MVSRRAASVSILVLALVVPAAHLRAAELHILAGGGITAPLREIGSQFERESGHTLVFRFGTTPELITLVTAGAPFDLAVVPRELLLDAAARARLAAGPTVDIARVGLGVAVRSGAPKPDISTPEALKQTLLRAQSIATTPASAAGAQVLRVFDTLGLSEAMKARMRAQPGPAQIVDAVARGEAELGVFLVSVLTAPGLDVVGPFPADLQQTVVYTASVAASTKDTAAANAFIAYLRTPNADAILKARGMEPLPR